MNNYQLYRTNVKLGGQTSWNLVLDNLVDGNLKVKYFDLTPISPYVEYKYGQHTDCLKYSHQENLRTLYKEIKGQFYDAEINPELKTLYPVIEENKVTRDPSLDMGCSRISFDRYNKQLQYLCPIWLEDFKSTEILKFSITIYNDDDVIATKSLVLDLLGDDSYHDSFVKYFRNYVNSLNEKKKVSIGDELININIKKKFASITGTSINTGEVITKDISNLVPNLFERERPLMETDFMLIDNFHTSEMICKQLFNFNLVFDISDIVTDSINSMLIDNSYKVRVDVYKNNNVLEKKAFNNDYSNKKNFKNILSYLRDYDYINTVHTNKLAPDICHWTLADNTSYVFNLYPGFGTEIPYFYKSAPNYWETDTDIYPNVLSWCKCIQEPSCTVSHVYTKIIMDHAYTTFDPSRTFVGLTRFKYTKKSDEDLIEVKLTLGIVNSDDLLYNIAQVRNYVNDRYLVIDLGHNQILYSQDTLEGVNEYIILACTPIVNSYALITPKSTAYMLSYKFFKFNVLPKLENLSGVFSNFKTIYNILSNIIEPEVIYLYNSLKFQRVDGPWVDTEEISYVKDNSNSQIVIRYDGKIKPMFSNLDDIVIYRIRTMLRDDFEDDKSWDRDQTQGFMPYYPSKNYYNLETTEKPQEIDEYKWFDESLVYNLQSVIKTILYSKDIEEPYYNDEYLVEKVLKSTYPSLTDKHYNYLRNLYDTDVDYEYDGDYDIQTQRFNYKYTIKLTLR